MIRVDDSLCTHCGLCVKICPFAVLELQDGTPKTIEKKAKACISCMHCVAICPVHALSFDGIPKETETAFLPDNSTYSILKDIIKSNRSIRHFSDQQVPLQDIREILNVVSLAPSAKNQHPSKWILVYDSEKVRAIMSNCLKYAEENNVSREIISEFEKGNNVVTMDAPHLIFGIAPKEGAINPYTDTIIALTDIDLLLHSKSIGSCWAGYLTRLTNSNPATRELIGLDESMQVYGALAFGYPKGERYENLPYRNPADISVL